VGPVPGHPTLSVVVPTRNEEGNVAPLLQRLDDALSFLDVPWEVVFVDDSDDTTPRAIEQVAASNGHRVSMLHRPPGNRPGGLGGAVKEGFALAGGSVIVVMDADLQHPPEVVPCLVAPVLSGECDLAAGSRYGGLGSNGGLSGPWRRAVSVSLRWLAHTVVPRSRCLTDPLSGLFAVRRSVVEDVELRPEGYKILLEVVARGNWNKATNVGYQFAERRSGRSKADLSEGLAFLRHLWRLSKVCRAWTYSAL
jgi:dolichol-phosphate mannosyltransferase